MSAASEFEVILSSSMLFLTTLLKRGIYVTQHAVPILPSTMSKETCSLNPVVECLAFSFVFAMAKGKIFDNWLVIR
jgi:hypothetical protein